MTKKLMLSSVLLHFLMVFCSLVVSVLFFGTSSKAATRSEIENLFSRNGIIIDSSIIDSLMTNINFANNEVGFLAFSNQIRIGSLESGYDYSYGVLNSRYGYLKNGNSNTYQCYTNVYNYNSSTKTVGSYIEGAASSYGLWSWTETDFYDYTGASHIDFDNLIYAVNIPVPELDVTYVPAISMLGGLPQTNNVFTSINVGDNAAFKVQLAVKITVADMVQIGLTDGTTTYKYLDWTEGSLSDIYSLEDLIDAEDIYISNDDLSSVWDNLYDSLYDDPDFPIFSSSVPFWNSNPSAQKYLNAQSYYRNNMARQMPMYGTRLEVFARYFAIDNDNVYVGAWRHWSSAEPLNTEKVTDKYQDQQPFPGTENTNTNVDYDTSDDTYTTIGTQTGVYNDPYTQVVINQNVPNYPDYPTAVSYNHDNILLQMIQTANQLPNFFGQFGEFLTATFSFIDPSVWAIIGFGFMCSIVVMIIKVL